MAKSARRAWLQEREERCQRGNGDKGWSSFSHLHAVNNYVEVYLQSLVTINVFLGLQT